ncbi:hypothetical protein C0993_003578 [Termitomyces sp. T159_Od127]|nr:hypothetical protein C0993_003578 [Termitomyces sp. T159_Od127]
MASSIEDNKSLSLTPTREDAVVAYEGVKTVEATHKVYGKYSKWFLFIGLGLAAYIYSLDGSTTYTYLSYAASAFEDHTLISTIQVAQSIIIAVGKPVIAKVADVTSRGLAYTVVLIFYVVGYIVIASSKNIQTVGGGIILYAIGYTYVDTVKLFIPSADHHHSGLQLLTQIIIADITTLKWRGLVSSLISMPFIINAFIGANVSASVIKHAGWRWGYGMFAILIPVSLLPLITTLLWAENKAKKLGITPKPNRTAKGLFEQIMDGANRLDIPGLVLIGTCVALILLPLTLSSSAEGGWNNPSMIAMIVIGCVLVPFIGIYEFNFAKYPVIPRRFAVNRSIVIASIIGALDFISFYLSFTYLYSYILIVKPWSLVNTTYFTQTQTVALTVFGIVAGLSMRFMRRTKWLLVVGLGIRILGVGLMIHSRGAHGSDAELVWTQLLQGIGGGFAAVASQVSAQAAVPHADVAMCTAVVLLITEIGGAIGSGIAGAIWSNLMPDKLAQHLPFVSEEDRAALFGSITTVLAYDRGTPIREGVIAAYSDVMKVMIIVATVIAVVPFALSFLMPNWYLGDKQNAVEDAGLAGERVVDPVPTDHERQ